MMYWVTSAHKPASGIIKRFRMKRLTNISVFQVFSCGNARLTVTGGGAAASAAAVSRLLTLFPPEANDTLAYVGECRRDAPVTLFNALKCPATGKTLYPDMLYPHPFVEGGALRSDTGGALRSDTGDALRSDTGGALRSDTGGALRSDTGDAAAVFQTANLFMPPHAIFVFGIGAGAGITPDCVCDWVEKAEASGLDARAGLTPDEEAALTRATEGMRLSYSMARELRLAAWRHKALGGDIIRALEPFADRVCAGKAERGGLFAKALERLFQSEADYD